MPDPATVDARLREAFALHRQGRLVEAEAHYRAVIAASPRNAEALHFLGVIAYRDRRLDEAERSIAQALAVRPDYAEAHYDLGNVRRARKQPEAAIASYERALALRPGYVEALNNRGSALMDLGRFEAALASCAEAAALRPGHVRAHVNCGSALARLMRFEDALARYDAALALKPDYATAWFGRANSLKELRRLDEALESYERGRTLEPDNAEIHWNESLCRLLAGDLARGWDAYEWRWRAEPLKHHARHFPQPLWRGGAADAGRTILLHAEQGYGDTIQFCRYVPMVAARGLRVVLEVQRPLKSLLAPLEGVAQLIAKGEPLPPFDLHCPLLSLPRVFGTTLATIPARVPYLAAAPERIAAWRARLDERAAPGPRIGLSWSGNPTHRNDRNRSIDPAQFAPLLAAAPGATFVSLQKTLSDADRAWLVANPGVVPLGGALGDFADTAALLSLMDLVIAVDTAVAHLAGAMGRPVWILLPHIGLDWRWLVDRADSPWYPTARLYRQPPSRDWRPVIEAVAGEMGEFTSDAEPARETRGP